VFVIRYVQLILCKIKAWIKNIKTGNIMGYSINDYF
jgi:hypothetical protein